MIKYVFVWCCFFAAISCGNKKKDVDTQPAQQEIKNADFGELYQYYHSDPKTLDQKEENTIIEYAGDKNLECVRTRSGVYIANHQVGQGDSLKWGDPISVHYSGYFLNGELFDSSIKRGTPISFRVGSMIAGWNEALPFLKVGSKATFIIPSHMAYGKKGFEGFVGPDEILLFDIEILEKRNQKQR